MRTLIIALTALASLSLLGSSASATTVLEVGVHEMTRLSDWVVKAHVVDLRTVDLRHEGKTIYTDVELAIDDVYRGDELPATYVLRLIGGVGADGLAVTVPGMPRFTRGEDVVLFLEPTPGGRVLCGLGQGVWRIHKAPQGVEWVEQASGGLHMMARDHRGTLTQAQAPNMTPARTLDQLVAEIYEAQLPQE